MSTTESVIIPVGADVSGLLEAGAAVDSFADRARRAREAFGPTARDLVGAAPTEATGGAQQIPPPPNWPSAMTPPPAAPGGAAAAAAATPPPALSMQGLIREFDTLERLTGRLNVMLDRLVSRDVEPRVATPPTAGVIAPAAVAPTPPREVSVEPARRLALPELERPRVDPAQLQRDTLAGLASRLGVGAQPERETPRSVRDAHETPAALIVPPIVPPLVELPTPVTARGPETPPPAAMVLPSPAVLPLVEPREAPLPSAGRDIEVEPRLDAPSSRAARGLEDRPPAIVPPTSGTPPLVEPAEPRPTAVDAPVDTVRPRPVVERAPPEPQAAAPVLEAMRPPPAPTTPVVGLQPTRAVPPPEPRAVVEPSREAAPVVPRQPSVLEPQPREATTAAAPTAPAPIPPTDLPEAMTPPRPPTAVFGGPSPEERARFARLLEEAERAATRAAMPPAAEAMTPPPGAPPLVPELTAAATPATPLALVMPEAMAPPVQPAPGPGVVVPPPTPPLTVRGIEREFAALERATQRLRAAFDQVHARDRDDETPGAPRTPPPLRPGGSGPEAAATGGTPPPGGGDRGGGPGPTSLPPDDDDDTRTPGRSRGSAWYRHYAMGMGSSLMGTLGLGIGVGAAASEMRTWVTQAREVSKEALLMTLRTGVAPAVHYQQIERALTEPDALGFRSLVTPHDSARIATRMAGLTGYGGLAADEQGIPRRDMPSPIVRDAALAGEIGLRAFGTPQAGGEAAASLYGITRSMDAVGYLATMAELAKSQGRSQSEMLVQTSAMRGLLERQGQFERTPEEMLGLANLQAMLSALPGRAGEGAAGAQIAEGIMGGMQAGDTISTSVMLGVFRDVYGRNPTEGIADMNRLQRLRTDPGAIPAVVENMRRTFAENPELGINLLWSRFNVSEPQARALMTAPGPLTKPRVDRLLTTPEIAGRFDEENARLAETPGGREFDIEQRRIRNAARPGAFLEVDQRIRSWVADNPEAAAAAEAGGGLAWRGLWLGAGAGGAMTLPRLLGGARATGAAATASRFSFLRGMGPLAAGLGIGDAAKDMLYDPFAGGDETNTRDLVGGGIGAGAGLILSGGNPLVAAAGYGVGKHAFSLLDDLMPREAEAMGRPPATRPTEPQAFGADEPALADHVRRSYAAEFTVPQERSVAALTREVAPSPRVGDTGALRRKADGRIDLHDPMFHRVEHAFGIPKGVLPALAEVESSGDPHARPIDPKTGRPLSSARGLFQFLKGTARDMGLENPDDPEASTLAAAKYLRQNYDKLGSWEGAIGAHYGGPGAPNVTYARKVMRRMHPYQGDEDLAGDVDVGGSVSSRAAAGGFPQTAMAAVGTEDRPLHLLVEIHMDPNVGTARAHIVDDGGVHVREYR